VQPSPSPQWSAATWLIVGTTCLGAFAGQVDASIVQLGLPALEVSFDARLDAVSWVAIAYSLSFAAALPVYARLAEMGGRKPMYVAGFALFGLFSALSGLAPDLAWLITFRVLQGLSGALLGANSVVILVTAAGPERRGHAMGLFAASQAVGVCAGPAIGGIILADLSWHWIFWVTVPVALAGSLLGWAIIPGRETKPDARAFDWPAALALVPALVAVQLAITQAQAWGTGTITACAGLALALGAAFVWRERRTSHPLLDLHLFASRPFASGTITVFLSYAMLYGLFFAMSFALVRGYGFTPLVAGLHLAALAVALGVVSPFAGAAAETRPRAIILAGLGLCLAALAPLAYGLSASDRAPALMLALALYGVGLACVIAPNNSETLHAAPPDHAGQAGGLLNLMRALGTATGIALMSAFLSWRLAAPSGGTGQTHRVSEADLLAAVREGTVLLGALTLLAVVAILAEARQRAA
jgi:EmrB/QacA subfamily drug resistance transporter